MASAVQQTLLAGTGISKRYPGVVALDHVDFTVHVGEVHGLIGENGAGKSTLMKILAGIIAADDGLIRLDDQPIQLSSPRDANDRGIALVHQELNLVPYLTVAENIFLGRELVSKVGLIRSKEQERKCYQLLAGLDRSIDPRAEVRRLRVGQQQVVEIAKAINCNARVIFMDEPTSAISDAEVAALFKLIRSLRSTGVSIVYVSHKLDELLQITDRITVLRDGKLVQTVPTSQADRNTIVRLMVGRELNDLYVHSPPSAGQRCPRLRVDTLTLTRKSGTRPIVDSVSFEAYGGEVLGIFGLMGSGRTELLETIFGLHAERMSGTIWIDDQVVTIRSPSHAIGNGLGLVPEDRKHQGLILSMSVDQNISLSNLQDMETGGLLSKHREREQAERFVKQFAIKASTVTQPVRTLSGGNQQKVVLSKVLSRSPRVLMLDEPTRGIDVHAKREIYSLIDRLKGEGKAVIVVSSELPEILGIADRIIVMCEGRKTAEFDRRDANEEALMQAAVPKDAVAATGRT